MKHGYVARVRVMPADIMTCIDLVQKAGIHTQGMSLSQCISLALKGLAQGARNTGMVPKRDGFEYSQMVAPFLSQTTQVRKLHVAKLAEQEMVRREAFDLPPQGEQIANMAFNPTIRAEKMARMEELKFKRDADPINFSDEDRAELERLATELIIGYQ